MKRCIQLYSLFGLALSVTACGGSSSSAPETETPPPPSQKPVATDDAASSLAGQAVTIDVLANDSDPDNQTLTLSSVAIESQYGTAEVVEGTILYTPATAFFGTASFSYTVSNGQDEDSATIEVQVSQPLAISGKVIGMPAGTLQVAANRDMNAAVPVNDAGEFAITLMLDDANGWIELFAHSDNQDKPTTFAAIIGNASDALQAAGEDGTLTRDEHQFTHLSSLSTAHFVLSADANDNVQPSDTQTLNNTNSLLNAQALLDTASFIQLMLADNTYNLTVDTNILTWLEADDNQPTIEHIERFERANDWWLEFEPQRDFESAKKDAAIRLLQNSDVYLAQSNTDAYAGNTFVALEDEYPGTLTELADLFQFDADGNATRTQVLYEGNFEVQSSSKSGLSDGKISLGQSDSLFFYTISSFTFWYEEMVDVYGQEVADFIANQGELTNSQIREENIEQDVLVVFYESGDIKHAARLRERTSELALSEVLNTDIANPTATNSLAPEAFRLKNLASLSAEVAFEAESQWAIPFEFSMPSEDESYLRTQYDLLTLESDGSVTRLFGTEAMQWQTDNGELVLTDATRIIRIAPLNRLDKQVLSYIAEEQNGQTVSHGVRLIAKADATYAQYTDGLPYDASTLFTEVFHLPKAYDANGTKANYVVGHKFAQDNEVIRSVAKYEYNNGYAFFGQVQSAPWQLNGREITYTSSSGNVGYRQVLSVQEDGTVLALDYNYIASFGRHLNYPRLVRLRQVDLANWPEYWSPSPLNPAND